LPGATGYLAAFIYANILPCAAFIYSVWVIFKRKKDGINFILAAATAALFAGMMPLSGAPHEYYLALMPLAALVSAFMIMRLCVFLYSNMDLKKYAWAILGILLVFNIAVVSKANNAAGVVGDARYTKKIYYEQRAMAQAIVAGSFGKQRKDNFVFAWPDMPAVYFITGAKAASLYPYAYPLDILKEDKPKLVGALIDGRPSWVLMQKGTFQPYQAFLDNYYAKETETEDLVLYRNILY
jgi:hypothetical protein